MKSLFRFLRGYFTGHKGYYQLTPCSQPVLDGVESAGLYLHIPFCTSFCPYCPYHKVAYDADAEKQYCRSLDKEITLLGRDLPKTFRSTSLYIGGGTPTLCMDTLEHILPRMRDTLHLDGDLCIETGPNACDARTIERLHRLHVNMVSIGVQSFQPSLLQYLGRNTSTEHLESVIQRLLQAGFDSVNLDFIFAIPGQTDRQLQQDLDKAVQLGAEQITLYPLFSFPYSSVQNYRRHRKVAPPRLWQERRQFKQIKAFFDRAGFVRSSIWSFRKNHTPRYSSATRSNYIGIGSGAGSHLPWGFTLNTFDMAAYHARLESGQYPTALGIAFTPAMHQYFWLYWRLYDTAVSRRAFWTMFDPADPKINRLLWMLRKAGILDQTDDLYRLYDSGAFWIHLLQNRLLLEYINTVWTEAKRTAFPERIRF